MKCSPDLGGVLFLSPIRDKSGHLPPQLDPGKCMSHGFPENENPQNNTVRIQALACMHRDVCGEEGRSTETFWNWFKSAGLAGWQFGPELMLQSRAQTLSGGRIYSSLGTSL